MKYFILFLIPLLVSAQSIESLYKSVDASDNYKSKVKMQEASFEQTKASLFQDSWSIGGGVGYANVRDGSDNGIEFGVNISKNFNFGGDPLADLIAKNRKYVGLYAAVQRNRIRAKIWTLYGDYCITMAALQAKASLSNIYDDMRGYIQKGVEYGEFDSSKAIMAQLALDNLNLEISKLENAVQNYEAQIKVLVAFDGQFECKKISPDFNKLFDPQYSALWPLLENKKEISQEGVKYAKEGATSVSVSLAYNNEIDTDRYMLFATLPLNYGLQSEAKRKAAYDRLSATTHEIAAFENSYRNESAALQSRIAIYRKYLKMTEQSIAKSANKLITQSKMRFVAGEESLISMLKSTETKLQMIETILQLKVQRHNSVGAYMYKYAIDPYGVK